MVHSYHSNRGFICSAGEWWLEYCRFFKGADIELLAVDCGQAIPLPVEFDRHCELLKGIERFHCPVLDVTGARLVESSFSARSFISFHGLVASQNMAAASAGEASTCKRIAHAGLL